MLRTAGLAGRVAHSQTALSVMALPYSQATVHTFKIAIHDDPDEMANRFDDPSYRPIVEALMTRAYRIICDTDDPPLGNATYRVLTLAPCGPEIPART